MKRKTTLTIAAILAASTLSLTSCGGGGSNDILSTLDKDTKRVEEMTEEP